MNIDKKKILNLIHADFVIMNGGKNNMKSIAILIFLFCGGVGFLLSPLMGLYVPLLIGGFFVPMLFQNEIKYHSGKMYALLPIKRKDLVKSRFLMSIGLYVSICLIFYLLMLLSLKLELWYLLMGEDTENIDVIGLLVQRSGGRFTKVGLFNLLYFSVFSFGLITMSGSLRKYFKDNKSFSLELTIKKGNKDTKKQDFIGVLIAIPIMIWVLIVCGILPIGATISLIMQILSQLAGAVNGFLLSIVLITIAVFSVIYKYICTVLEYDEKEL